MSKIEAVGASERDQKAPNFEITNLEAINNDSFRVTYRTNEGIGRIYYVVTTLSSTPTKTQIWNGLDSNGDDAEVSGFERVRRAGGNQTFDINGIPSNIEYFVHLFHRDWINNDSTIESTTGLTIENLTPLSAPIFASENITTTFVTATIPYTASVSSSYQEYRINSGSVSGSIFSNITINPIIAGVSQSLQPGQYTFQLRSVENTTPLNYSDWSSQIINLPSLVEDVTTPFQFNFIMPT